MSRGACSVSRMIEHLGGVALGLLVLSVGVALVSVSVFLLLLSKNQSINWAIRAETLTAPGIIIRVIMRKYTSTNDNRRTPQRTHTTASHKQPQSEPENHTRGNTSDSPGKAHRGHKNKNSRQNTHRNAKHSTESHRASPGGVLLYRVVFWCTLL